ncbi:hypothetical protein [Marinomonas sp. IMCC 4694]|uniref:hypothetical protein n=1 Tax=Marinomonas sp. IMCC 4694 TaxID=2605432 RepID=UPI001CA38534|nr:hypothetical protein [Marinomonas sp. IMCC 4694]
MKSKFLPIGVTIILGLPALVGSYFMLRPAVSFAEENAVTFPPLDQLEHYTTVKRGITREHMLTNPAALAAIKAGQPVPVGTHVVLVDYQDDVLTRYLGKMRLSR